MHLIKKKKNFHLKRLQILTLPPMNLKGQAFPFSTN